MVLSSNTGMATELPKMNVMHSSYKPSFHLSSYTSTGSYPKIKAKEISTDPLPKINTLFKQKKVKQVREKINCSFFFFYNIYLIFILYLIKTE